MTQFLQKIFYLLHFLESLKQDILVFGDFIINTLKHQQDRTNYDNPLMAYDLEILNIEPTRVAVISDSCIIYY